MKHLLTVLAMAFAISSFASNPATGRYKMIVDQLVELQSQYPQTVKIFSVGTNDDDVEILGVRISTNAAQTDLTKAAHFMVATHHGNETHAPIFAMKFIRDLVARYQSDETWKGNLGKIEYHIIPVLNISGYNADNRYEHGVDPNRDYVGPCSNKGGKLKSIKQMLAYLATRPFVGSVTVHGYDGSLSYPWGMVADNDRTHEHDFYSNVTHNAAKINGYQAGTAAEVIYAADGCFEDYVYWKYGMYSILLEIKDGSVDDLEMTTRAIAHYYDQMGMSPSTKNQFVGNCTGTKYRAAMRFE